jgi:hypothetical protein
VHEVGLLFAGTAPLLLAHRVVRRMARRGVEPAGEQRVTRELCSLTRQGREHDLADIRRQVHIAVRASQRGEVDGVQMPLHQLRECSLRSVVGITAQQFGIVGFAHGVLFG